MTRMFEHITRTWNPIVGCRHNCQYCWARKLAETKLKNLPQYRDGFTEPKLVDRAFKARFKAGENVFVSDMGDMWGDWVPRDWILRVLDYIKRFPRTTFLFLTKNPSRYHEFLDVMPSNVVLGATIETNIPIITGEVSDAPSPIVRYEAMRDLDWSMKLVSIEPILIFDMNIMIKWILDIKPVLVYVGYDNYKNQLKEPPLKKTLQLIKRLKRHGVNVKEKTIRRAWYEINH